MLANFITEEFKFKKAAVLYDVASDYPKGLAEFFKMAWERLHGPGSVVAYESFTTKDTDFSSQLTKIKNSGAQVLFTPQYYNEVALIVQQAHQLGWKNPIVGSDSWGSAETVSLCGKDCYGLFFSTHYAAAGATGATKEFIDPVSEEARLRPRRRGRTHLGRLGARPEGDRGHRRDHGRPEEGPGQCVRAAMSRIKNFKGITGEMTFTGEGDPIKCAVIVRISDKGEFEFYKSACP